MLSIDGSVGVRCSLEKAWDLFCRFEKLASLIPSVERVEVDGDDVHAHVGVKLGRLSVHSRVKLTVVERKPLSCIKAVGISYLGETIRTQIKPDKAGIDAGSVGRLSLHLDLREGEKAEEVMVVYTAEVEAEGRLKRVYQSILKTKAPAMMEEFAANIRTELEAEAAEEAEEAEEAAPQVPVLHTPSLWGRLVAWLRRLFLGAGSTP